MKDKQIQKEFKKDILSLKRKINEVKQFEINCNIKIIVTPSFPSLSNSFYLAPNLKKQVKDNCTLRQILSTLEVRNKEIKKEIKLLAKKYKVNYTLFLNSFDDYDSNGILYSFNCGYLD